MKDMDLKWAVMGSVLLMGAAQTSHAAPAHPDLANAKWFIGADFERLSSSLSSVMRVNNGSDFPSPYNLDEYSISAPNPLALGLQAGRRWDSSKQWFPAYALSVRYQHVFRKAIEGSATLYSMPEFNNYAYQLKMSSDVLSLYGKLDITHIGSLMPYVAAGLGMAFNQTSTYSESAYSGVTPRISPAFGSHTTEQFAYNLGAGFDYAFNDKIIISIGYEYQNFGKISSGRGQTTWGGERLSPGRLSSNTGLIGVTYLWDK